MSQLARISTSFIRNPPASLNRHGSARYHGLPTDVLKKSNPWKISRFTPSSLPCATSKDNEAGTRKGKDDEVMIFKGRMMILRLVLDDDDPQNHIIDSLAIFRMALNMWKHFRPDFELHYGYEDLKVPPTLPRLSVEATSKKISVPHAALSILAFLQEFDDPEVADQVLLSALQTWKNLMWGIEVQCANKYKHDDVKKKKKPIPLAVTWWLKAYKMLIYVAWEIFTPLLHKIDDAEVKPLSYKQGSRGPAEADELLAKAGYMQTHGYVWIPPTL